MTQPRRIGVFLPALLAVLTFTVPCAAQIQIFSTGQYGTPETISLAPAGFGAFGGKYIIPDARTGQVWVVPVTGGPPAEFPTSPIFGLIGGMFLPSGWGVASGNFVVCTDSLQVLAADGTLSPLAPGDPTGGGFATPLIAPDSFAGFGGHLFVADESNTVWESAPGPSFLRKFRLMQDACPLAGFDVCPLNTMVPFGLEFTPPGWGANGNRLLVSHGDQASDSTFAPLLDADGDRFTIIVAVAPDHTVTPFATIKLAGKVDDPDNQKQTGLRQMLMLPDDFLVPSLGVNGLGKLVLVSVSGSGGGGGVLGETLALDSSGNIKGHLITGSATAKFDPRGMILTADNHVLISDTSDPIWKASALDFAPGRGPVCSLISTTSKSSLWPANHDLVNVGLAVTSACPARTTVSVYGNEDDQADTGDGNFSPDAANVAPGTLRLRSERSGNGNGRVYLIVAQSTDSAGTVAASCNTVVVPHSQSKKDIDAVNAEAATAKTYCQQHAGAAPPAYFVVGDGPVIGPKQ